MKSPQALVLLLLIPYCSGCYGQEVALPAMPPAASEPKVNPKMELGSVDWSLLSAAAGLRFLDYKSTVKCMSDPARFHEDQLPAALVRNRPALGAYEAGTVVANYYVYRLLIEHRHRTLARLAQSINIGAVAWAVGHNYYEIEESWPRDSPARPGRQ
jgi:hypothetical protein